MSPWASNWRDAFGAPSSPTTSTATNSSTASPRKNSVGVMGDRENERPSPITHHHERSELSPLHPSPSSHYTISTAIPSGAHAYIHSATSIGKLMQPWLIGTPKFSCQYVPCNAWPRSVKYITSGTFGTL